MHTTLKTLLFSSCLMLFATANAFAGPGDTIKVQTFTFGSAQQGWFEMPSLDVPVEKILMKYTLKCVGDPGGAGGLGYPCGEWDYLTYSYLYQHTGAYDSTLLYHAHYTADGVGLDTIAYANAPTYTNDAHWEYYIVHDDTTAYNEYTIGTAAYTTLFPFYTGYPVSRSQFIWHADELTAAGLTAGDISGMDFSITGLGIEMQGLTIKMGATALDDFSGVLPATGLTTVYQQTTSLALGWSGVDFTTPFTWDGTSNIVVEISYSNNTGGFSYQTDAEMVGFQTTLTASSTDKYLQFLHPDYADVLGNPLDVLSDKVTVAFWAQGNADYQPQNGTTFEAVTTGGARVLNSHTPWGDSNVYWDAGNDGGYDRINKSATAAEYENNWVYWAFEKDATTGVMQIYKNGTLWHTGSGKTKLMEEIAKLRLGQGNWGGSESYAGNMDEFAVWKTIVDPSVLTQYMYKDLDDAHPNHDDLLLYYHFNDGDGITEPDAVAGNDLGLVGASAHYFSGEELFRNFDPSYTRPIVRFEQGTFTSHIDSVLIAVPVETDPFTLITYDPADPTVGIDTQLVWPGDFYTYVYDTDGTIIDSMFVPVTNTLINEDLPYYSDPFEVINRFELGRFITPYGIDLSLGDGFTWTYDVSDYRPLLHDSVDISAGNWQEWLDLQFWFIEGTPPRDVHDVTNLWSGAFGYGLATSFDDLTPDREITIPEDADNTRVKIRVTGHGFGGTSNCAEFCAREHYFMEDGATIWSKDVWRDNCDLNPVYPQGGTWVYDRSNWCPGAEVWTYDFELTPHVTPGSTHTFDYDAESYTWNGAGSVPTYVTEVQLVTYGAPNFTLDAALEKIKAPSSDQMWDRLNPVCHNPTVVIKNTGSTPLTSLDITYGIKDYDMDTYTWTGLLNFMESEEVVLPNFGWTNAGEYFEASVSNPNGGTDQYMYNNTVTEKMKIPVSYPNQVVIDMRTNNASHENDLFVYNENGDIVFSRTTFTDNTVYKDTLTLEDGCYSIYLWDYGEDGLSWWANTDGSGYFRLRDMDGTFLKVFDPDFGGLIYQEFTVGNYTPVADIQRDNIFSVYPNPTSDEVFIDVDLVQLSDVSVYLFDITGKELEHAFRGRIQNDVVRMDVTPYAPGTYFVRIEAGKQVITKPLVISR
ncbi:MAG: peptide-N-glycosidase F-related protein [Chitinophagales bacterium]